MQKWLEGSLFAVFQCTSNNTTIKINQRIGIKEASYTAGMISTFPDWKSVTPLTCQPCRPSHYLDEAIAKCLHTWLKTDLRFINCHRQRCLTDWLTCVNTTAEMLIKHMRAHRVITEASFHPFCQRHLDKGRKKKVWKKIQVSEVLMCVQSKHIIFLVFNNDYRVKSPSFTLRPRVHNKGTP